MGYVALIPITIICVLANHMGLVGAIEKELDQKIPIVDCSKCATFWFSLIYLAFDGGNIIISIAASFCVAYLAVWLELLLGIIDKGYDNIYEKFFWNTTTEVSSNTTDTDSAEDGMP